MLQRLLGFSIKNVHTLYYRRLSGAPKRSPDLFLCGFHAYLLCNYVLARSLSEGQKRSHRFSSDGFSHSYF